MFKPAEKALLALTAHHCQQHTHTFRVSASYLSALTFSLFLFLSPLRDKKKTKPLNLKIPSSVGSCENLPTQLHAERSLRSFFFPSFIPSTPPVYAETPFASTRTLPPPSFKRFNPLVYINEYIFIIIIINIYIFINKYIYSYIYNNIYI